MSFASRAARYMLETRPRRLTVALPPCSPPGRPNVDRVPPVTGGGDPRDRLLHRRDDHAQDDVRPSSSSSSRPGGCTSPASPPTPTRRGSPSKPGTSPSRSGCREFGSSFATGTPSSRDRSMRCSAARASGSSDRRSAHLGRMHSPSGSFRTVRRECLDHVLIYSRRHLERVLQAYVAHYVEERPHRGLSLAVPAGDRPPRVRGAIPTLVERRDVLGGLVHEYRWAA